MLKAVGTLLNGRIFLSLLASLCFSLACTSPIYAEEKQVITIVTPYPDKLSSTFQFGFEEAHPGLKINLINAQSTGHALNYVKDKQNSGVADLFWASSVVAFDTLKQSGKLMEFDPEVRGIPDNVSGVTLHDPDGYYTGFSVAGYGYILNERYLKAWRLPVPKHWSDLSQAHYHGHLSMATPSLSGSTHGIVESILQGGKWQERWYLIKRIAGNMKRLMPESFQVALGVRDGEYALGTAIDYYGLSMQLARAPVRFIYPEPPTLSAAYIGVMSDAPNPEAAKQFINYLLSRDGQALLFDKNVGRLPIRSDVYKQAPGHYPNPFTDEIFKENRIVDLDISKQRYHMVNTLFDKLITFNLNELKAAVKSIQCVEQALLSQKNEEAEKLLMHAEEAVSWVPFDEMLLDDEDYLLAFERDKPLPQWDEEAIAEEGIAYQPDRWSRQAWTHYQQAKHLADQALKLTGKECRS